MEIVQLVISVLALVLSVAGLVWQAATFKLSGHRVRAQMLIGASSVDGIIMSKSGSDATESWFADRADEGYRLRVVAINVQNVEGYSQAIL